MAWENLPTNYKNAKWAGLKKYRQISNTDGTVSFEDVTSYTDKEDSFFGAEDANAMNESMNNIMSVGIIRKNLLHNWFFGNPINRLGVSDVTNNAATTNVIDRWYLALRGSSLSVLDDCLKVTGVVGNAFGGLTQQLDSIEVGRTVTFSVLAKGTEGKSCRLRISKNTDVSSYLAQNLGTFSGELDVFSLTTVVSDDCESLNVNFYPDNTTNGGSAFIYAAKLEYGDVQTLARQDDSGNWVLFEIPDYAEQYALCSQYDLVTRKHIGFAPIEGNAGYHNSIYRGKFLGNAVTEEQYAAISAGTFDDLYIGDYWTINGVNYRIAAFDYYYNTGGDGGNSSLLTHHVTLVPDKQMYNHKMNDDYWKIGAYVGSKMYTEGLNQAKETINAAFGSAHVLTHRKLLPNDTETNGTATTGYSWYDSTVELMSERNVYGCNIYGTTQSSIDKSQYPLFAFRPDLMFSRSAWCWLLDVGSDSGFALVDQYGKAGVGGAASSNGVRPTFSIIG